MTGGTRSKMFPDVPTFAEAGLQGLVAENWWGVFLPAGTPKAVVDSYHSALVKVMADPDLKAKFADSAKLLTCFSECLSKAGRRRRATSCIRQRTRLY